MRWASSANVLLGLWLVASPFVLVDWQAHALVTAEDVTFGLLIAALACWRVIRPDASPVVSWVLVLVAVWVAIAPFVLGYRSLVASSFNDAAVALLVFVFAITDVVYAPLPL